MCVLTLILILNYLLSHITRALPQVSHDMHSTTVYLRNIHSIVHLQMYLRYVYIYLYICTRIYDIHNTMVM
jgi:hypothetical protein